MKILVMGLPGSGKTTLATVLARELGCAHYNADKVREQFNDWDFSAEGRLRQAHRMSDLAEQHELAICDFVCPLPEMRDIFNADILIWMDTIKAGRFSNTNQIFVEPTEYDLRFPSWNAMNVDIVLDYLGDLSCTQKNALFMKTALAHAALKNGLTK